MLVFYSTYICNIHIRTWTMNILQNQRYLQILEVLHFERYIINICILYNVIQKSLKTLFYAFYVAVTCLVFVSTEVITSNVPLDYFESKGTNQETFSPDLFSQKTWRMLNFVVDNKGFFFKFRGNTPLYSISVSTMFLSTSLPPTPNWDRFDLQYM